MQKSPSFGVIVATILKVIIALVAIVVIGVIVLLTVDQFIWSFTD